MDLYCVVGNDCDEPTSPVLYGYSENPFFAVSYMNQLLEMGIDSDLHLSKHQVVHDRDLIDRILHENKCYDDSCLVHPGNVWECQIVAYTISDNKTIYITERELEDISSQIENSEEYLDSLRSTVIEMLFYIRFLHPYAQDQIRESLRPFIRIISIATAPKGNDAHSKLSSMEEIIDPVAVYAYLYNLI